MLWQIGQGFWHDRVAGDQTSCEKLFSSWLQLNERYGYDYQGYKFYRRSIKCKGSFPAVRMM